MTTSVNGSYQGVVLTAPVSLPYTRFSEHGAHWFIGRTLAGLLEAGGLAKADIDGLAVSSFTLAPDSASTLTQYFNMSPRWLEQAPFGGASGIVALRRAARAVQAGDANIVACIGADTNRREDFQGLVSNFSHFTTDASYPYGAAGPNAAFSLITSHYMEKFGATREDFGRICIAQRYNAHHFPSALLGDKPLTMEDYLDARRIAGPLHLFDCVMPCAGGEGFLVMTEDRARSLNLPYVRLLSAEEQYNAFPEDPVQYRGGWELFRDRLYARAGLGPNDMDLLQTYDDYPVISMLQMEGLGFCDSGKAPEFVRSTALTFDGGGLPHNTSGGQLSLGQAGSAPGYMGLAESIRQLTDRAPGNQVENARYAMVSGYGMINYDRGLCTGAAILGRAD